MTTRISTGRRLSRVATGAEGAAPVRIVHLGLGAFHRAHQAWYTAHSTDAADWGIAAFTGRSTAIADALTAQDGLFTLLERGPHGDRVEIVPSISLALAGDDVSEFVRLMARPEVAILTLTITESGYRLDRDGGPDLADPAVRSDIALLARRIGGREEPTAWPETALGRILLGLDARRRAGLGGLAVVPCDNIPDNGRVVRDALVGLARAVSGELAEWLSARISFVSTSVDRITPRPTETDGETVRAATGWADAAPVVTEPFSDWVLSGDFPSGRPAWETAGARFVDDIAPWEARKLWMLNGAHTALAAAGSLRGHEFVSTAILDTECRSLVERLWDEDARHLPDLELDAYRDALVERFANTRLDYSLAQIATDAVTKLRVRIVPVARLERGQGRRPLACAGVIAAWIAAVRAGHSAMPSELQASSDAARFVGVLDESLSADSEFCADVTAALDRLTHRTPLMTETS